MPWGDGSLPAAAQDAWAPGVPQSEAMLQVQLAQELMKTATLRLAESAHARSEADQRCEPCCTSCADCRWTVPWSPELLLSASEPRLGSFTSCSDRDWMFCHHALGLL